jgi:hypothetical protein
MPDDVTPPMEMLTNPLLTEDGFVNEACMKELAAAINGIPDVHVRCADDPEWNRPYWTFPHNITGPFAMWAVRQSPYGCPDGLETVVKYLTACLRTAFSWDTAGMAHLTLWEISEAIHRILLAERRPTDEERFSNNRPPDADFIDLHALLTNTVISIRDERRRDDAFDAAFEAEHGKLTVPE